MEIPFYKRDEFIHQKEYRIVINTGTVGCDHRVLDVGDIRDIAFGVDTADVYSTTELRFTSPGPAPVRKESPDVRRSNPGA